MDRSLQDMMVTALSNLRGTFSFQRKVNYQNRGLDYESAEAFCSVQFDFPPELMAGDPDSASTWLAVARQAANYATAVVAEKLGLEVSRDEDGVLREVFKEFPGAVVTKGALKSESTVTASAKPPYSQAELKGMGDDELKAARKENSAWAKARYDSHPQEFFDNRKKKATDDTWANSPDFTHKDSRVGFWND